MSALSGLPSLMRARSGARVLGVLALTILVPGALLVALAARALIQESQAARVEITDRLERAAEHAGQAFQRELADWQTGRRRQPHS